MAAEYFETSSKKGRGRAQKSIDLIEAMCDIAEAAQPITGRGVGYKLFTVGLIPSMARSEMQRVYRLLKEAREEGIIPWEWIVDEGRQFERVASWDDPAAFVETVSRSYRRDFWNEQPARGGAKRARCAASWRPFSTSMASASASCTALAAPLRSTILPRMTTAAR